MLIQLILKLNLHKPFYHNALLPLLQIQLLSQKQCFYHKQRQSHLGILWISDWWITKCRKGKSIPRICFYSTENKVLPLWWEKWSNAVNLPPSSGWYFRGMAAYQCRSLFLTVWGFSRTAVAITRSFSYVAGPICNFYFWCMITFWAYWSGMGQWWPRKD